MIFCPFEHFIAVNVPDTRIIIMHFVIYLLNTSLTQHLQTHSSTHKNSKSFSQKLVITTKLYDAWEFNNDLS